MPGISKRAKSIYRARSTVGKVLSSLSLFLAILFTAPAVVADVGSPPLSTSTSSTKNSTTTAAAVATANTVSSPSRNWNATIHDLEQKLELDLQRVEYDARHPKRSSGKQQPQQQQRRRVNTTTATAFSTLDNDLGQVRTDIHELVQSIEAAERELESLRARMQEEQHKLRQKTTTMKTQQLLDHLHSGKINVKVDYDTGKLIANNKRETSTRGIAPLTNATMTNATEMHTTMTLAPGAAAVAAGAATTEEKDSTSEEEEQAIEDIIEAASGEKRRRRREFGINDGTEAEQEKKEPETVSEQIENNPDLKNRLKQEIESIRAGADPAVLSLDVQLLVDVVALAMTAAFFGLAAVFLRLPPTAGFLLGGMMIGPSFLDLIGEIKQVQTLAQFGAIFLLFEQGLLYSQTYSGEAVLGGALSSGVPEEGEVPSRTSGSRIHSRRRARPIPPSQLRPSLSSLEMDHDPNVIGTILLILLVFTALAIVVLLNVVSSVPEAIVVSCCIAMCSTTIVSENLHATQIAQTHWGHGLLKMIAMHDLFMMPLLALPELLASLVAARTDSADDDDVATQDGGLILRVVLVALFVKVAMVLSKHIVAAASLAQSRILGERNELFTLSIVAYVLLLATVSDQLHLSIEAGSVLAGIVLMKSSHVPKVLISIQPITSVFGGMYMTSLGMIISPSFVGRQATSIVQLVVLISLFKLALVSTVLNRFFDYGITPSLAIGSAMAQISEISLLVMAKAQRIGLVGRKTYLLLIPTTCILLALAPCSTAHLRRLKMQEVTGDDGRIPTYLCFLRQCGLLRPPRQRNSYIAIRPNPSKRVTNHEMEEGRS